MAAISLADSSLAYLKQIYPSKAEAIAETTDAIDLSHKLYPDAIYTDADKTEIRKWVTAANHIASPDEDEAKTAERLSSLNTHLATHTTLLGSKPSVADVLLYSKLAPIVSKWSSDERTGEQGYHHIVRHLDWVQNSGMFGIKVDQKVSIDLDDVKFKIKPIDAKAEKERKKKEKEAAAAGAAAEGKATPTTATAGAKGGDNASKADKVATGAAQPNTAKKEKKEKKEKQPKPQKQPAQEKPLSPCLIDLRVGHILKAIAHPNADSLYVSTIAVGDAPGTENTSEYEGQVVRTVCSGLNGLIPLEEMQNRKIIAVCNLKPVTMRGIKSCAMVLAASPKVAEGEDSHGGPVELVSPPADSKAGDRVYFEGWEGEPEAVLNPKKKIWEAIQPGFTTTDGLEVGFDVGAVPQLAGAGESSKTGVSKLRTAAGLCSVPSLKGATVR